MSALKPVPINTARKLGEAANADRLVILAFDSDGMFAATSWGKTRSKCRALAKWLDDYAGNTATEIDWHTGDA